MFYIFSLHCILWSRDFPFPATTHDTLRPFSPPLFPCAAHCKCSQKPSPRPGLSELCPSDEPGARAENKSCDSCGLLAAVPRSSPARRRPSARSPAEARSLSSALHSLDACFSAPVQTLSLHSRRAGSVTRRHSDANVCSPPPPLRTTGPWRLCLTKYHVYILRAARHGRQRHCSSSRSTSRRSSSGTAAAANNSAAVQLQRGGLCEAHIITFGWAIDQLEFPVARNTSCSVGIHLGD